MKNTTSLPQFSQISADTIESQLNECLQYNQSQIAELLSKQHSYTWNNLLAPLDELDNTLHKLWSPVTHLHAVVSSDALRKAYQQCIPALTKYSTEIGQNRALFEAVQAIADSDEFKKLDTAQQKVIDNELRDFRLAGVALSDEEKQRFKALKTELATLTNQFEEHILDATDAWSHHVDSAEQVAGIPEHALAAAKKAAADKDKSGWLFNLEFPSFHAVITYADDESLREMIYHAYVTRASDQGPHAGKWDNSATMTEITNKRHEVATMLGFEHYADYSLARKMAESPQQVMDFLQDLVTRAKPQAQKEYDELCEFAREHHQKEHLNAWDIPYYSEKLRQHRYQLSQEELRPYFPEQTVIEGMFHIANKLYGIIVKPLDNVDTWHEEVRCYVLHDEQGELIGHLYMDLYARANKRAGAWMGDCAARYRQINNTTQTPVAFLNCNFSAPTDSMPSLLTHDEVITLFHECGHSLHHLLTQIDYLGVSGINGVAWDAVELPSQFFENWCWQPEAFELISKHYQTGEALPQDYIDKLTAAKNFQAAMQMVRQLEFSLFDFRLHSQAPPIDAIAIQQLLNEVRYQVAVIKAPSFNRFQHSFSHIFAGGYAAGYYSYKWAEVLAADAFSAFEESGIFDKKTGRSFLHNILQQGGAKDAMDLFVAFRGRKPSIVPLLRHCGIEQK